MVENTILLLTVLLTAAIIGLFSIKKYKIKKRVKFSFKESMDLADLPIVTFYTTNNKLNFLLDTGSNLSFIDPKAVELLENNTVQEESTPVIGCGGNSEASNKHKVVLMYKGELFNVELLENPALTEAFSSIKKQDGVQIHGILGSLFFKEYEYVLDFAELVAYQK